MENRALSPEQIPPTLIDLNVKGYLITGQLGQGGMGTVYLALHQRLDRLTALKVIAPSLVAREDMLIRFQREAQAAARLNHPNIVQIYDYDIDEKTRLHFIVMEYVSGDNLINFVLRDGPFNESDALNLLVQSAHSLHHAHEAGIIHRDVKPENLLLSDLGVLKLTDLGLAKVGYQVHGSLTQVGDAIGTPFYISPEQVEGGDIDHRSDIYSLGATFYHLLTGQPPFSGKTSPMIMVSHVKDKPADPRTLMPEISESTAQLILQMLEKDPAKRPQSMAEIVHIIELNQKNIRLAAIAEKQMEVAPEKSAPEKEKVLSITFFYEMNGLLRGLIGPEAMKCVVAAVAKTGAKQSHFPREKAVELVQNIQASLSQARHKNIFEKEAKVLLAKHVGEVVLPELSPTAQSEKISLLYITELGRNLRRICGPDRKILEEAMGELGVTPRNIPLSQKEKLIESIYGRLSPDQQKELQKAIQYLKN
ncbi:MAG: serine/threonine-protein kinase [Verrucomicrobiae bacterium]|nr:serine/threonine-protein kinase [Verrucomicrobiae bacterium]